MYDSVHSTYETRGRPTKNPKNRKIQCRVDEETDSILIAYCEEKKVSESEAIRKGIRKLVDELSDNNENKLE